MSGWLSMNAKALCSSRDPMSLWTSLSRRAPASMALPQAASMAAAECLRIMAQSPMMARSASGPRASKAACAHSPQRSPSSAARPTHWRQEASTGALSPAAPRMCLNLPGSMRVWICTCSMRSLKRRTQRLSQRTHTVRPMYSGGAS